ncbi:MAG: HNH endonuclease [Clostridium sp.]|nr:HNH endonuclease [Clostridium sp.]
MKITAINNYNQYYRNKTEQRPLFLYQQINKPPSDTISFKRKKVITDLRQIPNITCACCGDETIPNPTIDKLFHDEMFYPANEAIDILKKAGYFKKKSMTKSEATAFQFCETYSKLYKGLYVKDIFEKDSIRELIRYYDAETRENIARIESMMTKVYKNSEHMVKVLEPYEHIMHKAQKEVFEFLKQESQKTPEKNFTEILNNPRVKEDNLKKLEEKQALIFSDMENIASEMSPQSYKTVLRHIRKAKIIFDKPNSKISNKRQLVITMFKDLEADIPENDIMLKILSKVYELPSSRNDANSFIIKYADNNPNEIADKLLRGAAATIEHVKPRNRKNDNGKNDISNYIVLCGNCNSERNQIPYSEFIKFHPDMPQNIQKYLDRVIKFINKGILIGYDKYPQQIRRAVEDESDKKINLIFNTLNIIEAEKNRNSKKRCSEDL